MGAFSLSGGQGPDHDFIALYDMLRNASRVSLTPSSTASRCSWATTTCWSWPDKAAGRRVLAADRAAFVRAFFDYARANPGGRPQLWTRMAPRAGSSRRKRA